MYKKEINKIKDLINPEIWEFLKETNAMIAGGALTSMFTRSDINDIDIYFRSIDDFLLFLDFTQECLNHSDMCFENGTSRSLLATNSKSPDNPLQFIIYKFFPKPEDIFKDFDFTINMAAIDCRDEKLILHDDFLKHCSQRYLSVNQGTAYPIISVLRANKYMDRGYYISKNEMLKLLLRVNSLSINSWDEIKDHIGGMYGLDMDEVFNVDEEYSLDKSLEILNGLDIDGAKPAWGMFNYDEFTLKLIDIHVLKENRINGNNRYFKNVEKDEDGNYCSCWDNNFKYVVGEDVQSDTGIFFYKGKDVIGGMYNSLDNYILELEPEEDIPESISIWDKKLKTTCKLKVKEAYTRTEFIKTFYFDNK